MLVVGGGAAGMMAAISAASAGARVHLLEKTQRLGFKIRISGGGRCNVTNQEHDLRRLLTMYPGNGQFLRAAFKQFPPERILELLHRRGVATKIEPQYGKIFPISDRSEDVISALAVEMRDLGVTVTMGAPAGQILTRNGRAVGIETTDGRRFEADAVILCVGGKSLPNSGSTGDGYAMVTALGHTVTPLFPSLVPLKTTGVTGLAGVALRDVEGTVWLDGQRADRPWRGDLLFTHSGVSGPIVLQLSRAAAAGLTDKRPVELRLNLRPDQRPDELDRDLQALWQERGKQQLATLVTDWMPKSVVPVFLQAQGLDPQQKIAEAGKDVRRKLANGLQQWRIPITAWQSFDIAEVTAGGVALAEVDAKTMASTLVPGLYFAGEILDVDGYVGGFNFQAAWSTGWVAGQQAARTPVAHER